MKKAIRFSIILILLTLQCFYLGTITIEKFSQHTWISVVIVLSIAILLWFAYLKAPLHHHEHDTEDVLVAVWVPVGAIICYLLSTKLHLGSVIGAGIVGTVASFIPALKKESNYLKKLPIAIYCGAFVGMSSESIAPSIGFIVAAGIFTGILLLLSKSLFLGVGGKLGTLAFAGVTFATLIYYLLFK